MELVLILATPYAFTPHACPRRVTRLDHEALETDRQTDRHISLSHVCLMTWLKWLIVQCNALTYLNDSMEYVSIEVAIPAVHTEIFHRFGTSEGNQ